MPRIDMPETDSPLWQKYLIEAAIGYFNDRGVKPGLVIDNELLQDGVLQAKQMEGYNEFVICVAPGYTTQLKYGNTEMVVTARFDSMEYTMHIPYYVIRGVVGVGVGALLSEDGHTNVIRVPAVIYPKQVKHEHDPVPQVDPIEISTLEHQPTQEEMIIPNRAASQ